MLTPLFTLLFFSYVFQEHASTMSLDRFVMVNLANVIEKFRRLGSNYCRAVAASTIVVLIEGYLAQMLCQKKRHKCCANGKTTTVAVSQPGTIVVPIEVGTSVAP